MPELTKEGLRVFYPELDEAASNIVFRRQAATILAVTEKIETEIK